MRGNEPRAHDKKHHDRQIEEVRHDPYLALSKPAEPTVCPQCGVVYHGGRWQRLARPAAAHEQLCPACHRIRDNLPAGIITLGGAFAYQHADEILALVRNEEAREANRHPLQRIMAVTRQDEHIVITTTDVHVARRIGDAVAGAFGGTLSLKYSADEYLVRVDWTR
jgi:NMD protein affecting ribosome stability and mRNA decay